MKLLNCTANNFASYEHLEFDFSETGLALLYGPTGAGKSTIMDLAAWGLYGVTAKNGNVDDIRSWQSNEPTEVTIDVQIQNKVISIKRIRGTSKQNDLYWLECTDLETMYRGKDISETQKLLEARLGVSSDLFLTAAYYQEFAKTGQFFTAPAKNRRQVLEEVADLSFPTVLAHRASNSRKEAKKVLDAAQGTKDRLEGAVGQLRRSIEASEVSYADWQVQKARKIAEYKDKSKSFEEDKAKKIAQLEKDMLEFKIKTDISIDEQLAKLDKLQSIAKPLRFYEDQLKLLKELCMTKSGAICKECKQYLPHQDSKKIEREHEQVLQASNENVRILHNIELAKEKLEALVALVNPYVTQITAHEAVTNYYKESLPEEAAKPNPFKAQLKKLGEDYKKSEDELQIIIRNFIDLETKVNALTQLIDLTSSLRGELLKKAVHRIETETNRYLETYFDAEIKVTFTLGAADSLDVGIQKSGYECCFTQLSKGQRSLLKLCFSLAVQEAAANKAGVHFENLMLDEPTDGMDSDLKMKAYALFEELATKHQNVLVIDHDKGLQNLFTNKYRVTLEGDYSKIEKEDE